MATIIRKSHAVVIGFGILGHGAPESDGGPVDCRGHG